MSLQDYLKSWSGYAVRHIPDNPSRPYDIYDFTYCGKSEENRWNVAGEPTLYLAKEKDVALAECARHFQINRTPSLATKTYRRLVYRFQVNLDRVTRSPGSQSWKTMEMFKNRLFERLGSFGKSILKYCNCCESLLKKY
jgi:hypothetical protein